MRRSFICGLLLPLLSLIPFGIDCIEPDDTAQALAYAGPLEPPIRTRPTDDDTRGEWHEREWVRWYAATLNDPAVQVEHTLIEGSRVDILTTQHAFEVDYAEKWDEGVGQCLFYAAATGRAPALLLLLHRGDDNDRRDYLRALVVCNAHKIRLIAVKIPPKSP